MTGLHGRAARRSLAVVAAALSVASLWGGSASGSVPPPDPDSAGSATSSVDGTTAPIGPLVFGTAAPTKANLLQQEADAGHPIAAVRVFRRWDDTLFGPDVLWMRDTWHTVLLSVKTLRSDGTRVRWADIAAARPGSPLYADMQRMASQIKAFGARVFVTLDHEPERLPQSLGTGPQFAAAFRAFVDVMRSEHVANAQFMAIFTGWGFVRTDANNMATYYPGDSYVSMVGVDAYNSGPCQKRPWKSLGDLLEGARVWGLSHPTVRLLVTEFGSAEDPAQPGRKAQWYRDAEQLMQQPAYAQFGGVVTFGALQRGAFRCDWDYTTSPSAQAAWESWADDSAYSAWQ